MIELSWITTVVIYAQLGLILILLRVLRTSTYSDLMHDTLVLFHNAVSDELMGIYIVTRLGHVESQGERLTELAKTLRTVESACLSIKRRGLFFRLFNEYGTKRDFAFLMDNLKKYLDEREGPKP